MSDHGEDLLAAIRQTRKLYNEIALLLATADTLMEEAGWDTYGNTAVRWGSTRLQASDSWLPQDAFRFYKHSTQTHLLAFVSVILDDIDQLDLVQEPLVCAGWYDCGHGEEIGDQWEYFYCRQHLCVPGRRDDGSLISIDPRQAYPDQKHRAQKVTTFALPLVGIASAEDLHTQIIEPLVTAAKG